MRHRLLILFMLGLLLCGCGGNAADSNPAGDAGQQIANSEELSEKSDRDEENNVAEEETESTEQQVYVLEFNNAVTTEGESVSSDLFSDSKLTMINVWATFCGPCINEMPDLGEIAGAYDDAEFQLIGIVSDAVEGDADMLSEAKAIIEETGADYPHLLLNEELYANLVGASDSVPTTYFVNQKGELLGYLVGAQSKEVWEEVINGLLEEME